eukprot:547439_1
MSSQNCETTCSSCCHYNLYRLKFYMLIVVITICIMIGVDYGLRYTNKCFNTYYMFAELFSSKGSYEYLCYQNEIKYSLAIAIILMLTFHTLFSVTLFHICQTIIFKQKGINLEINYKCKQKSIENNKAYNYRQPSNQKSIEMRKKRKSNGLMSDNAIARGRSSDATDDDVSTASDQMLASQRNKTKEKHKKKKKKYGALKQEAEDSSSDGE